MYNLYTCAAVEKEKLFIYRRSLLLKSYSAGVVECNSSLEWWCNEPDWGKPKCSERTSPSAALSTTNPTWTSLSSNLNLWGGRSATNYLSHDTEILRNSFWPLSMLLWCRRNCFFFFTNYLWKALWASSCLTVLRLCTNGRSSLPMEGSGEVSYMRFIIKFVCTWRFWLKSDKSNKHFSRRTTCVYEMSLCLMFVSDADCIFWKARAEAEENIDYPNTVIEHHQYFTISEVWISNLLLPVRYR